MKQIFIGLLIISSNAFAFTDYNKWDTLATSTDGIKYLSDPLFIKQMDSTVRQTILTSTEDLNRWDIYLVDCSTKEIAVRQTITFGYNASFHKYKDTCFQWGKRGRKCGNRPDKWL
jgi:hypothetical protein